MLSASATDAHILALRSRGWHC